MADEQKTTWKTEVMSVLGMALSLLPSAIGWISGHVSAESIWAPIAACAAIVLNYQRERQATKRAAMGLSLEAAYDPAQDPNLKK